MRTIASILLSIGLFGQNPGAAPVQAPAPTPGMHVVIDAKGIVHYYDSQTGKEIARGLIGQQPVPMVDPKAKTVPTDQDRLMKLAQDLQKQAAELQRAAQVPQPGSPQFERMQKLVPQPGGGLDGTIERLIRDLDELRRELKSKQPFPQQPLSIDQKLDMLLMQMGEMRRDIKELQERMPAKKGPGLQFQFKEFKGPMKKPDAPGLPDRPAGADAVPQENKLALENEVRDSLRDLQKRLQVDVERERARAADEMNAMKIEIKRLVDERNALREFEKKLEVQVEHERKRAADEAKSMKTQVDLLQEELVRLRKDLGKVKAKDRN